MITNEHSETLPSSCSSTTSSCSSSASTTGSSSISTLSSNHTGTNSSSTSSTTNSSPSTSHNHTLATSNNSNTNNNSTPSNNNSMHPAFLNKQDQLAFDFHLIMNDLKTVCGTLSILAKQIDQIVNKMDDKFNLIIENLHQDELVQQNNKINSQRIVANSNNNNHNKTIKLSNLIKCTNNGESNLSKTSSNSSPPQLNSPNFFFSNNPSKPKPLLNGNATNNNNLKPNYPNETILANLINENYVNILNNNQANRVNRSYSDRNHKPLVSYSASGEEMRKNLNLALSQQQSNTNTFINSNREAEILSNSNSINGSIISRPSHSTFSFNAKPRCIRSKSQPAFIKTENLDYHSFILNSNNNSSSKVTTTTTKTILENVIDENKNAQTPNESSFYEDQLDNELESFDNSSKLLLSNLNNNGNIKLHNNKKEENKLTNESVNVKTPSLKSATRTKSSNSNHHVSFNINNAIYTSKQETPIPIPISILKQTNKTSDKNNNNNNEQKYSNLGNGPLNLISFPSTHGYNNATTSMTTSPSQTLQKQNNYAMPATFLISEQQQQNLQLNSDQSYQNLQSLRNLIVNNNNNNNNNSTSSINKNRIDTKTTIL